MVAPQSTPDSARKLELSADSRVESVEPPTTSHPDPAHHLSPKNPKVCGKRVRKHSACGTDEECVYSQPTEKQQH